LQCNAQNFMTALFMHSLESFRFLDILDLLLVGILIYQFYRLMRGTSTINIFVGIVSIYLLWKLVKLLKMELLSELLGAFISVGVIALIVVFQPEIRKFLLMLGTPDFLRKNSRRFLFWKFNFSSGLHLDIDPLLYTCQRLSTNHTGALLIIGRHNELGQFAESGTELNARISSELLQSIFFPNAPLHDGAVIIAHNKIKAAGCILPVSANKNLPSHLGLRHRAAAGVTEVSDAVGIVISEETGKISIVEQGNIREDISSDQLKNLLNEAFSDENGHHTPRSSFISNGDQNLFQMIFGRKKA